MAANAAVAAVRLGASVQYWGRVADDPLGRRILDELAGEGVDVSRTRRVPGARSPVTSILVDARGERLICSFSDPGLDADPTWLPLDEVASFDAVMVDVRWPAGGERVLAAARRAGRPALLDADVAAAGTVETLSASATHVLFSEAGLVAAGGAADAAALARSRRPHH